MIRIEKVLYEYKMGDWSFMFYYNSDFCQKFYLVLWHAEKDFKYSRITIDTVAKLEDFLINGSSDFYENFQIIMDVLRINSGNLIDMLQGNITLTKFQKTFKSPKNLRKIHNNL